MCCIIKCLALINQLNTPITMKNKISLMLCAIIGVFFINVYGAQTRYEPIGHTVMGVPFHFYESYSVKLPTHPISHYFSFLYLILDLVIAALFTSILYLVYTKRYFSTTDKNH